MILSIFKMFISNLFSFGGAFGEIKKGPRGIAKIIGIGLLVVFCSFSFISMTLMTTYNIYTFYKSMDMPQMTVFFLMASSVMILCFFGFFCFSEFTQTFPVNCRFISAKTQTNASLQ